jgi:hypothetical protein
MKNINNLGYFERQTLIDRIGVMRLLKLKAGKSKKKKTFKTQKTLAYKKVRVLRLKYSK